MVNDINIWETYRSNGLHVFPTKNKKPAIPENTSWKVYSDKWIFNGSAGLACGKASGGIEVIDIDTKHYRGDIDLMTRLSEAFTSNDLGIDLVIQKTINKGFHFIYKCEVVGTNEKLARHIGSPEAFIETRGEGGYIIIAPSYGYEIIEGDIYNIPVITPEERERLITICRSLNEYFEEVKEPKKSNANSTSQGLTPWEDFNQRGDVVELLQAHRWTYLKTIGDNQHFCRPDKSGSTSATWSEGKRLFYCFTSSTIFEPSKAYSPAAVYTYLECNKDFTEAGRKLYSLGYGERSQQQQTNNPEIKTTDWKALQIVSEPPEQTPLISIGGSPIATAGNYSQIIGKKKSRKTLFLTWLVSQYLGNGESDVLLFDTEQGTRHVWKVMDRIKRLTGYQIGTFYLRGKSPAERRAIIQTVVAEYPTRPKLIIIDGIRDLLSNINDADQVSELLTWMEKITLDNGLHVVNVLHMNKTDNNARGHLGSELLNKSEITIELERDEQADCTIVRCESSRDIPFESFAFRHDTAGLPEIVGLPTAGKVLPEEERKARLRFVFQDKTLVKYAELVEEVKQHFAVGTNKAKNMTAEFNRIGWLVKSGNGRDVVYKCMV